MHTSLEILQTFIFSNCIFLGVLVFILQSKNKIANPFLSLSLLCMGTSMLVDFLLEGIEIKLCLDKLVIPLFYFYVVRLVGKKKILFRLFFLSLLLLEFFLIVWNYHLYFSLISIFIVKILLSYAINICLLILILFLLRINYKCLCKSLGNTSKNHFLLIKGFVIINLINNGLLLIEEIILFLDFEFNLVVTYIIELLNLLCVYWMGYLLMVKLKAVKKLRKKSRFCLNHASNYYDETIRKEKPYLKSNLTLRQLAIVLEVTDKQLSHWINKNNYGNFYAFINKYRIEEFKAQLIYPSNKNLSILGIAQNAGFRNKSTFYKAFKELEKLTPGEYRKLMFTNTL